MPIISIPYPGGTEDEALLIVPYALDSNDYVRIVLRVCRIRADSVNYAEKCWLSGFHRSGRFHILSVRYLR